MVISKRMQSQRMTEFADRCRGMGVKITPQRMEIYRELAGTSDHPSAEELHARIARRMPNVSLDTVYRTMHLFMEKGLVDRVDAGCDTARFDAGMDEHHHFICKRCGRIEDFRNDAIGTHALPPEVHSMGRPEMVRLVVRGVCATCAPKAATTGE